MPLPPHLTPRTADLHAQGRLRIEGMPFGGVRIGIESASEVVWWEMGGPGADPLPGAILAAVQSSRFRYRSPPRVVVREPAAVEGATNGTTQR